MVLSKFYVAVYYSWDVPFSRKLAWEEVALKENLVSWCFEPSQPQRITLGQQVVCLYCTAIDSFVSF